jgi:hypothetical protein
MISGHTLDHNEQYLNVSFKKCVCLCVRLIPTSIDIYEVYMYIRGRDSKQFTNGSKTAVMDVISFLYVSVGSSTVRLHDTLR